MARFPKVRYVPKDATEIKYDADRGVAYVGEFMRGGKVLFYAIAYGGKRTAHDFFHTYETVGARDEAVLKHEAGLLAAENAKLKARKAKAEFVHSLKVGDLLYSSWGYEQTNVDFYKVKAVRGKVVDLVKIGGHYERTHHTGGWCVPKPEIELDEVLVGKKVKEGNNIRLTDYAHAYPWAGRERANWSDGY